MALYKCFDCQGLKASGSTTPKTLIIHAFLLGTALPEILTTHLLIDQNPVILSISIKVPIKKPITRFLTEKEYS
ncbi:hypothetical protein ACH42_05745 [Endozoicomonas sp. (ex Bugula neritina AB1)]|nr:hypothetical protein ACH42_05745 [Endozoicomonas sp. (ex Bugula neritina AB1)]